MSKKTSNEGYKPNVKKGYQPAPSDSDNKKNGYPPTKEDPKIVLPPKKD